MILRSDVFRKALFGRGPHRPPSARSLRTRRLHPRLCHHRRPCRHLPRRRPLGDRGRRLRPSRPAGRHRRRGGAQRVPFCGIWLETPLAIAVDRVTRRTGDASDADAIVRRQAESIDSTRVTWRRTATEPPVEAVAAEVLATLNPDPDPLTCGRFALSMLPQQFQQAFACDSPEGLGELERHSRSARSRSSAPARTAPATRFARWGLLGPWMKEAGDPARQINVRSETAAEKPMFRDSFKKGRCLIPATGFYEWQKAGTGPSRPFFVALGSGQPFAFAGIWRRNRLADGTLLDTCAILTTDASPLLRPIHHRMPVILPEANQPLWLDPTLKDPEFLQALLTPSPTASSPPGKSAVPSTIPEATGRTWPSRWQRRRPRSRRA